MDLDAGQDIVNSLDDLYRSMHTLKIQKNGESTVYDTARPLVFIFSDMLSKVEEVYPDTPESIEKIKDFDYQHYDFRLKFDGAKDILFTREGNALRFEGEKKVYYLWGSADSLWDSLIFDDSNKTVDIDGEIIQLMSNAYDEDLDGDGKAETIELVYERGKTEDFKGNLVVRINDSEAVVIEGDEWYTKPYRTIGGMPEIWFLQEENGNSKALLVIYSWATNGIGSTGIINAYKYANGHISDVEVKDTVGIIKYKGDNVVNIGLATLNKNIDIKIETKEIIKFFRDEDSFKQEIEADHTREPHPLWYLTKDYNGDGQGDLCCEAVIRMYPFALFKLYSFYEYENGEIRPVQVCINALSADDERKSYLMEYIFDVITLKGYLTIVDNGIAEDEIQPPYDYMPDEIKGMLEELEKDKILKLKGDRLYVDF